MEYAPFSKYLTKYLPNDMSSNKEFVSWFEGDEK